MNIVQDTYEKLRALVDDGKEDEARNLLRERLPQLPEELQADIVGAFLFDAVEKHARHVDTIENVQKEGVAAMKVLVALKQSLEKGGAKA